MRHVGVAGIELPAGPLLRLGIDGLRLVQRLSWRLPRRQFDLRGQWPVASGKWR